MIFRLVFLICAGFFKHINYVSTSNSFEEVRFSPYFIDKTLLLKELFNDKKALIIATPSGFGKTFNLAMMTSFLTANETYGKNIFGETKIFKHENFTREKLGNYEVIYCCFKHRSPVYDYQSMIGAVRSAYYETFSRHTYLKHSRKISSYDKKQLTFFTGVKKHLKLTPIQILGGLDFLAKLMKIHHEKEVILMIDDFDTFILDSIFTKELKHDIVLGFHNAFFSSVLHKNENIKKTIMFGTTCISVKSLVHLREFECFGFLEDSEISPFFGITEQEISNLLMKTEFKDFTNKQEVRKWYNGYKSPDLKTPVYNTRSTLSFLRTGHLRSYWYGTLVDKTVKYLLIEPLAYQLLNESINYSPVEIKHVEVIHPNDIKGLKTFAENELWNEDFADLFMRLLMDEGYFTFVKEWDSKTTAKITMGIPNEEICTVLKIIITSFLDDPEELLNRLKAAVHEASFSGRAQTS